MKKSREEEELFGLVMREAETVREKVQELRRTLHRLPELSGEKRTPRPSWPRPSRTLA